MPLPSDAVLNIIIIGAGLSGLSAAISCARGGHNVTVLEGARQLAEIGAGLQITPNSSRLFQDWGVSAALEAVTAEPSFLAVHRYSDGKILAMEKDFNSKIRRKYGAPFVDLHRADLQRALYDEGMKLGVKVILGARVASLDLSIPKAILESGEIYQGDLIVGADGLWSLCRRYLEGTTEPDAPIPTGDLAYRIVLELDKIEDPTLREWVSNPSVHFWIGPDAHAVGYSLRGGTMYNIVLLVPDDLPEAVAKVSGSVDEMKKLFLGWDPILNRFLDEVKSVDKWKLMHRPELDSWFNEQCTLVMIGDACHPMLPYLAQGANSAIEDGAVLGSLLGNLQHKSQLSQALQLYSQLRKARGEAIVKETFRQRDSFHMRNGPEQVARDGIFLSQLGKEEIQGKFPSRWTCPEVQPWLYGYDATKEVDEALKAQPYK